MFVLCTGRCGSTTFARACGHASNFTSAHESRVGCIGAERLHYPAGHIEVDNRLSWFLGRLEAAYGNDAFYVHLKRNRHATAESFEKRYHKGVIVGYSKYILWRLSPDYSPLDVCLDYCHTVDANIDAFLRDKPHKMTFRLEEAKEDFRAFWQRVGAEGDLSEALKEWDRVYNKTEPSPWLLKAGRQWIEEVAVRWRDVTQAG